MSNENLHGLFAEMGAGDSNYIIPEFGVYDVRCVTYTIDYTNDIVMFSVIGRSAFDGIGRRHEFTIRLGRFPAFLVDDILDGSKDSVVFQNYKRNHPTEYKGFLGLLAMSLASKMANKDPRFNFDGSPCVGCDDEGNCYSGCNLLDDEDICPHNLVVMDCPKCHS